jgi:hypothetical protein
MADDDELLPAMVDYTWPDGECPQLTLIRGREAPDRWGRWWPIKGRRVMASEKLLEDYLVALDDRLEDRDGWMIMQFRISQLRPDGGDYPDWRPPWYEGPLADDDPWPERPDTCNRVVGRCEVAAGLTYDRVVAEVLRETEAELDIVLTEDQRALIGCPTETTETAT